MYANGYYGLESVRAGHGWDVWSLFFARRVEHEHAESDEGVAEEYGDGEEHQNEENVNFLAEVAIGKSNCKVCYAMSC